MDNLQKSWGILQWNESSENFTGYLYNFRESTFVHNNRTYDGVSLYFFDNDRQIAVKVDIKATLTVLIGYSSEFCGISINSELITLLQTALEDQFSNRDQRVYVNRNNSADQDDTDKNRAPINNTTLSIKWQIVPYGSKYLSDEVGHPYKIQQFFEIECANLKTYNSLRSQLQKRLVDNKNSIETIKRSQDQHGSLLEDEIMRKLRYDPLLLIQDIFEHDLDVLTKELIIRRINACKWYDIKHNIDASGPNTYNEPEIIYNSTFDGQVPSFRYTAWDLECYKKPLRFPDARYDPIMSVATKTHSGTALFINRDYFSTDIHNFRYDDLVECQVFNFNNEKELLEYFIVYVREVCNPQFIISYNGDTFDFPYLFVRCSLNGISLRNEWGFFEITTGMVGGKPTGPYWMSDFVVHIDCLKWVYRDSYLPLGSRSLKSVARIKLRRIPKEIDPELMVKYCRNKPQLMAEYNVSDSVLTFDLFTTYIEGFIFALASIIPLNIDDILRKGTGTLCECLLMSEAYHQNIIIPNKHVSKLENYDENDTFILDETYSGGTVEHIRGGVFRHCIQETFTFDPEIIQLLIDNLDCAYDTFLHNETKFADRIVKSTWSDVKKEITDKLNALSNLKQLVTEPLIYHVDVGAMYPNIILTNKLQPYAIVTESDCSSCVFEDKQTDCARRLNWNSRVDKLNLSRDAINVVKDQIGVELFDASVNNTANSRFIITNDQEQDSKRPAEKLRFNKLRSTVQKEILTKRLKELSAKVNRNKIHKETVSLRESIVCQRAIEFYVKTVRDFRDRRFVYKNKKKESEKKLQSAPKTEVQKYEGLVVYYESLQLAHKCILNSFYGYLMRKGARWHSIESAALTTYYGSSIIKYTRKICDGIGLPLELDTDGIWTCIPNIFPCDFTIEVEYRDTAASGNTNDIEEAVPLKQAKLRFNYFCEMLNGLVANRFKNEQYHLFNGKTFDKTTMNSIFFELDGPYDTMMLPYSDIQNKQLKKRYVVYNFKNKISELKGFEIKRRGELEMLKVFQNDVFSLLNKGETRMQVYKNLSEVAHNWLKFLQSKGVNADDYVILNLLSESSSLSKPVNSFNSAKTFAVATVKKLAALCDDNFYLQESGIKAQYVVLEHPRTASRVERAVPILLFSYNAQQRRYWLTKWGSSDSSKSIKQHMQLDTAIKEEQYSLRNLLDWNYYYERLCTQIYKLILVPSMMQGLPNLCSINPPDWLRELRKRKITFDTLCVSSSKKMSHLLIEELKAAELHKQPIPEKQTPRSSFIESYKTARILHKSNIYYNQSLKLFSDYGINSATDLNSDTSSAVSGFFFDSIGTFADKNDFYFVGVDSSFQAVVFNYKFSSSLSVKFTEFVNIVVPCEIDIKVFVNTVVKACNSNYNEKIEASNVAFTQIRMFESGRNVEGSKISINEIFLDYDELYKMRFIVSRPLILNMYIFKSRIPVSLVLSKKQKYVFSESLCAQNRLSSTLPLKIYAQAVYLLTIQNKHILLFVDLGNIRELKYVTIRYYSFKTKDNSFTASLADQFNSLLVEKYSGITGIISSIGSLPRSTSLYQLKDCTTINEFVSMGFVEMIKQILSVTQGGIRLFNCYTNVESVSHIITNKVKGKFYDDINKKCYFDVGYIQLFDPKSTAKNRSIAISLIKPLYFAFQPTQIKQLFDNIAPLCKFSLVSFLRSTNIAEAFKTFVQANGFYNFLHPSTRLTTFAIGSLDIEEDLTCEYCQPGLYKTYVLVFTFKYHIVLVCILLYKQLTVGYLKQTQLLSNLDSYNKRKVNWEHSGSQQYLYETVFNFLKKHINDSNADQVCKLMFNNSMNYELLEHIYKIILPTFKRQIARVINQINNELGIKLKLIYISEKSILITVPTDSYEETEACSSHIYTLLTESFNSTDILNNQVHYFSRGIIFNENNRLFLNSDNQIVDICLPMLNCLSTAAYLEQFLCSVLLSKQASNELWEAALETHKELIMTTTLDLNAPLYGSFTATQVMSSLIKKLLNFIDPDLEPDECSSLSLHWDDSNKEYMKSLRFVPVLTLRCVTCENCLRTNDLTVTNDISTCFYCEHPFNSDKIESIIIQMLHDRCERYFTRGYLICKYCKSSPDGLLTVNCECGGDTELMNEVDLPKLLLVFSKIGSTLNMKYLSALSEQYLQYF